jgi:hypothetical protein
LDGITNWYLLTDQDEGVQLPNMDLLGTDACNWTTTYQPPTANTGESCVWRFTDFRYKDGSTQENPILHIYVGPELITKFTSGGGMGVEFAYALFDKDVTEVILSENNGDLPVSEAPNAVPQEGGEWTKSLDTLSYDADSYLWMSQRKISADGISALWEKPIRLSGADGDPGKDAFDTEFIYHRSGRKPTLDDNTRLFNDNIRSQDDYYPNNSYWIWTDNPQGVDDDDPEHKYEWMAFRTKMDSSHDDYNPEHPEWVWSNWSTIRIWSAYGEKGMDGDGVQYIYNNKFVPSESVPKLAAPQGPIFIDRSGISHTWNGDVYYSTGSWYPKDWEDGIFDRWEGGNYNPQGEWIPGGSYNDQGQFVEGNWTDEPQGVGDFEIANPAFVEDDPVSETNPETITVTHPFEWVSTRKRVREVWGPFSEPTLWSTFSREHTIDFEQDENGVWWWVIDGERTDKKVEGENGKGIDLKGKVDYYDADHRNQLISEGFVEDPNHVYTFLSDVENTYHPEIGNCYVVMLNGHIYLYVGGDELDWKSHWSDFGEFQGEGAYVHIAWSTRVWTDNNGILHADNFAVDRPGNSTVEYAWMGICTNNDENDPGESNLTKYKWNYVHGRDGDTYERVYIRTERNVTPIIKKTQEDEYPTYNDLEGPHPYSKDEYLPFVDNYEDIVDPNDSETVITPGCYPEDSGNSENHVYQFSDDPKGVSSVYRYEWRAERKKVDGVWQDFGRVILESNYSNNGQGVIRSTVFKRSITQPIIPSGGDFISPKPSDSDWKDGLPTGTVGSIWMSSAIFTSDGLPPQSGWSVPILLQDSDTLDIELSTNSKNNPPTAPVKYEEATVQNPCNSHVPEKGEDGYDPNKPSEAIGDQIWYDPEKDVDYINSNASNFNWMATRTNYINPSTGNHAWRDWIIILIKGEAGEAGKEFQHAYLAYPTTLGQPRLVSTSTSYNTPPTTSATQGYNEGNVWLWTLNTTANITVGPEDSLWMTERWLQPGTNEVGIWDNPIRISGTGTPGEDAEDIQFIYKQSTDLPNDPTNTDITSIPKAVKENVDPVFWEGNVELIEYEWVHINWNTTANGEWSDWDWDSTAGEYNEEGEWIPNGWTDSPSGVDETNKYEWMCQRVKSRTNDPNHTNWGPWSKVFILSAYGDTGMDGDGIEYIFYRNNSKPNTPVGPHYRATDGGTPIAWEGGVKNVSTTSIPDWQPKDLTGTFNSWVYGSYNIQGEWIPTSCYDANNIIVSVEGEWTDEPQGVGEFIESNPLYVSGGTEPETIKVTYRNEWVSTRKRINGEWKEFSVPTIWSNYLVLSDIHIGQDGQWYIGEDPTGHYAEGKNGKGIQIKGTVDFLTRTEKNTYETNHPGETVTCLQNIYPHDDLYQDLDIGDCYVVLSSRYLYACKSNKISWVSAHQDSNTWEVSGQGYDDNWDSIGEFLGKGSHMHIAWAATKDPDTRIKGNNINFDSDGNITLIKKFLIDYAEKIDGVDYDWMGVCTNYDEDDPASDYDLDRDNASTTSWNGNWNLYKWNNVRGRDGDNYERVYIKSKEESPKPELNQNSYSGNTGHDKQNEDEFLPQVSNYNSSLVGNNNPYSNSIFTDDPTGVTSIYKYEWMAERKKKYNSTTKVVEWGEFSPPALWARYSEDGQHGNSVQVAYAIAGSTLTITDKTGDLPISSEITWYSTTTGLVPGDNQYLWMSQRVGVTGNWGLWEDPIRLSGQDGRPGEDGADIEFIYLRSNDSSAPSTPSNPKAIKNNQEPVYYYGDVDKTTKEPLSWSGPWTGWSWDSTAGEWNSEGEWIPVGWSDNPKGVGFFIEQNENHQDVEVFYKYEWACQRTKSAGNNQNWTQWIGPFRWSAYGDTGMDGDGIEYVYYRWDGIEPLVTPSEPKLKRIAPGETAESIISWNKRVEKVPGTSNPVQWQPKAEDWDESVYGSFNSWDSNSGKFNDQGEWIPIAKKRNSKQQEIVITTGEHPNEEETYWTDDPQGVGKETAGSTTTYYICEWVSVRKRINGGDWSTFSPPKLWASFGSDVKIIGGDWYINGVYCGKAEGEDGKGVALKGTVDVLNRSDRQDYARANGIEDYTTVKALQDIQPTNSLGISSINIGDCYVVKQNRYLYTSKSWFNSTDTPDDRYWNSTDQTTSNWWGTIENPGPGQNNWAEIGEFQGADGENSYMHIAWATDEAVKRADDGTILLVNSFIIQHEQLDRDTSYEWMGVCTSEEESDPPNDYDSKYDSSLAHDNGAYGEYESYEAYVKDHPLDYNWHLYKWNHVKGKDGSDYEKVYIKTKTNTGTGPGVNQNAYQGTGGHDDPTKDEFYPQVLSYNSNEHSNPTFTDDPTGPTATYPYEWVAERRKKLNPTTQSMEWGPFNSPATLWAMYTFEGMTAYLTKSSDSLTIDAANNPVGSLNSSRLYTEVKIYDPKANNGSGQYLTYDNVTTGTPTDKNKFRITTATGNNCTVSRTTTGKIYISGISSTVLGNKNINSCSVNITATVYGGKTFSFVYTVTFNRIPQTYLSYTLTNDSDTFTYRTRTKQYDGLPIETSLDVITTDGIITKLNDNTDLSIFDGYISSVTVKGKGDSNFLKYAKVTHLNGTALTGTNIQTVSSTNKTVTVESSESDDIVTYNTKTVTIYTNNSYNQATGLALDICSNGTITLKRTGNSESTDIDLADASHDLDITCVAELGGATYNSLVKTFKLSERNDATLYKLILSGDSFVKKEDGSGYSPSENTFSVNVNIIDGTGSSIESPSTVSGSLGLIRDKVFVRYLYNRAATSPFGDASYLKSAKPDFDDDITSNFFTVLVVEYDSNNVPTTYHDTETVNIVPPGVSTAYLDINFDRIVVDCDNTGKIINNDQSFTIEAYLRWGNLTCTSFTTKTFSVSGIGYTSTNENYSLSTVSVIDDSEDEEYGKVYATITFKKDKTLTSGYITIRLKGTFSNGLTKDLTRNIEIQANRTGATGPQGPHGNFKATAFTRTYDIISNLIPSGGDYDSRNYPDPTIVGSGNNAKTYTWHDGIPEGEETLWSTTGTFLGANYPNGPSVWSNPSIVQDSEIYDVEFAERQSEGATPSIPIKYDEATRQNPCNSHRPSGYNSNLVTDQIWYDPILDRTTLSSISSNIYWKAERTTENGTKGNWIITQIKGESEPWVSVNKDRFTFDVDPTGKLSSVPADSDKTLTIRLKLGNIVQQLTFVEIVFTAFSESSTTVRTYSTSATSSTYRLTITNDSETGDSYVSFVLPISSTSITYAPQRNLEITAKTNIYEATKTVKVEFDRKNRSSFKSFVFKRFASTPSASDAPSTTATGGSYANNGLPTGTSGRDSGWSDGLPNDGGTDPVYMSSRTFYSDNSQSTSWSTPVRMSDTDVFDVEFSFADSNPGKPGDTGKNWYDPSGNPPSGYTWADAIWMATNTKNSSGSWSGWVVVKIKGEGITSITPWYKKSTAYTGVTPPSTSTSLPSDGWVNNYIEPTREEPYLWKFTRTIFTNGEITQTDAELIQVWSENMINPNLLDDTEFFDNNHIGAWNISVTNPSTIYYSPSNVGTTYLEYIYGGTTYFYGERRYKQYYVQHKAKSGVSSSGSICYLAQRLYYESDSIEKVSPDTWYTLSFKAFALSRGDADLTSTPSGLIVDLSNIAASGSTITWTDQLGKDTPIVTETTKRSYTIDFSYNASHEGHWTTFSATFKTPSGTYGSSTNLRVEFKIGPKTYEQYIFITEPKVELGKIATEYIPGSTVRSPYPRTSAWEAGKQYYQGIYGEPYLDIVTYGGNWFRCRQTHISKKTYTNEGNTYQGNEPVINTTTVYWEPAENLSFIATDLVLAKTAFIENLFAKGLGTGTIGQPHVELSGATLDFYGNFSFPNIRMMVDGTGMSYLRFFDSGNNELYDLGPSGIKWLTNTIDSRWTQSTVKKMTSGIPDFSVDFQSVDIIYQFSAKKVNGVITGVDDPKVGGNTTIAEEADGLFFTSNSNITRNTNNTLKYLAAGLYRDPLHSSSIRSFQALGHYDNIDEFFTEQLIGNFEFTDETIHAVGEDDQEIIDWTWTNIGGLRLKYEVQVQQYVYFISGSPYYVYALKQDRGGDTHYIFNKNLLNLENSAT